MGTQSVDQIFETIYSTDLVYQKDCWKLCGDAHCCNFTRYKPEGQKIFQEIPLLPGEYNFLQKKGYLTQYPEFTLNAFEVELSIGTLKYESLMIPTNVCPCSHDIRPTTCRLYPLSPSYNIKGEVQGVDPDFFIPEIVEKQINAPSACFVTQTNFNEFNKFLSISNAMAKNLTMLFYLQTFQLIKDELKNAIPEKLGLIQQIAGNDVRKIVYNTQRFFIAGAIVEWSEMRSKIEDLARRFQEQHGSDFKLEAL